MPSTTFAAARKSSMRELVHEPIKIVSSFNFFYRATAFEAHILKRLQNTLSARGILFLRGVGYRTINETTISGEVPQVT